MYNIHKVDKGQHREYQYEFTERYTEGPVEKNYDKGSNTHVKFKQIRIDQPMGLILFLFIGSKTPAESCEDIHKCDKGVSAMRGNSRKIIQLQQHRKSQYKANGLNKPT